MKGGRDLKFSVVRYGNVLGSRGSVVPFFLNKRTDGILPITHEGMTRFNITLEEGVDMVMYAIENAWGGELFVPKIPSYRILDVANAVAPSCKTEVVGIRPGEKLHEEMITETDSLSTYDCGRYYVIAPSVHTWKMEDWMRTFKAQKVVEGFKYNSGTNADWLTVGEIREQIKKHIDPNFVVS
jgi:FlaA1/EpsC-like NDP-sugar epimerase